MLCSFCRERIETEPSSKMVCGHMFHKRCGVTWAQSTTDFRLGCCGLIAAAADISSMISEPLPLLEFSPVAVKAPKPILRDEPAMKESSVFTLPSALVDDGGRAALCWGAIQVFSSTQILQNTPSLLQGCIAHSQQLFPSLTVHPESSLEQIYSTSNLLLRNWKIESSFIVLFEDISELTDYFARGTTGRKLFLIQAKNHTGAAVIDPSICYFLNAKNASLTEALNEADLAKLCFDVIAKKMDTIQVYHVTPSGPPATLSNFTPPKQLQHKQTNVDTDSAKRRVRFNDTPQRNLYSPPEGSPPPDENAPIPKLVFDEISSVESLREQNQNLVDQNNKLAKLFDEERRVVNEQEIMIQQLKLELKQSLEREKPAQRIEGSEEIQRLAADVVELRAKLAVSEKEKEELRDAMDQLRGQLLSVRGKAPETDPSLQQQNQKLRDALSDEQHAHRLLKNVVKALQSELSERNATPTKREGAIYPSTSSILNAAAKSDAEYRQYNLENIFPGQNSSSSFSTPRKAEPVSSIPPTWPGGLGSGHKSLVPGDGFS